MLAGACNLMLCPTHAYLQVLDLPPVSSVMTANPSVPKVGWLPCYASLYYYYCYHAPSATPFPLCPGLPACAHPQCCRCGPARRRAQGTEGVWSSYYRYAETNVYKPDLESDKVDEKDPQHWS